MTEALPTVVAEQATLGILGGGQLGRYFVIAARAMGYRTMVLEPDAGAPAGPFADEHLVAAYDDPASLARFGAECAVVTTEFENPPADALARLAIATAVRPSALAIAIAQDRSAEKGFLVANGFAVAPYVDVRVAADLAAGTYPAILKTTRMGYDGKGQARVVDAVEAEAAWRQMGEVPCVLEQMLPLQREVSVVLARGVDGSVVCFPTTENTHVNGILDLSIAPVDAPGAVELATAIATALDYVGVMAVEMFEVDGALIVNELAPRPHNSGHWTLDAARTSQFEQQVRAVCGLPLGPTDLTAPAVAMVNLLGDVWAGGEPLWNAAEHPNATVHLYGKSEPRPGRKMGHLTVTAATTAEAAALALHLREQLTNR